jgi:tetratricopeptide (TPR) repeat protein
MKSRIWLALGAIAAVAVAASLIALPRSSEWSTDSAQAMAEFDAAVEAQMKLYHGDVQKHLEKALELDPDFVIAKLYLADKIKETDEELALRLWNDVLTADRSKLNARERVLVERSRALQEKRYEDASRMLDEYLEKHPNDPFVIHRKALERWVAGDFDEAERLNQKLIEIAPNWIIAYNQLGYIAMSRGRFVEAEEYFTSYRFVAPDQANPHDSLGELYLMLGRYDEAESTLLRSIEIRPDFWAAYDHLATARIMREDFAGAEDALAAARDQGDMPDYWSTGIDCIIRFAELASTGRHREILDALDEDGEPTPCLKGHSSGYVAATIHRAACLEGEWETAQGLEEEMAKLAEQIDTGSVRMEKGDVEGLLAHMRGVRLAVNGDYDGALEQFRTADDRMTYMQVGIGFFKLFNRLFMVETLFAAGQDGKAHQLLSKVRSVNPAMVEDFEETGLKVLGLERRQSS